MLLQRIIELSRHLLILPVIGSLLLMLGVIIMGFGIILVRAFQLLQSWEFSMKAGKMMTITVIQTLDLFLVGALGYITAVGFYKLFITQREDVTLLKRIKIESLADLEKMIIGVVVAALAVAFLGDAAESSQPTYLFYSGAGIALVIASLVLFIRVVATSSNSKENS